MERDQGTRLEDGASTRVERSAGTSVEGGAGAGLEEDVCARMGQRVRAGIQTAGQGPPRVGVRCARPVEEEAGMEARLEQGVADGEETGMGDREEAGVARREGASVADGEETGVDRGEEAGVEGGKSANMANGEETGMDRGKETRVQDRMEGKEGARLEGDPSTHVEEDVQACLGEGLGGGGGTPP